MNSGPTDAQMRAAKKAYLRGDPYSLEAARKRRATCSDCRLEMGVAPPRHGDGTVDVFPRHPRGVPAGEACGRSRNEVAVDEYVPVDADPALLAPVWLLDVDETLNVTNPGWSFRPWHGEATWGLTGEPFSMRWAPALLDRIRRLHTTGQVEVRWCTTWCPYADEIERLMRLPVLARALTDEVALDPSPNGTDSGKLTAAREVLAAGRRLIWTDDTAVPRPPSPVRAELVDTGRALLIRPLANKGLQPVDIELIEDWIRSSFIRLGGKP